jgi:hypothetical protein
VSECVCVLELSFKDHATRIIICSDVNTTNSSRPIRGTPSSVEEISVLVLNF